MILHRIPSFFNWFYGNKLLIKKPSGEKKLYLTFDDGPTPEVTDAILTILQKHHIKASFFCCGKNVEKNPMLFQQIIDEEHTIGNHSYSHINSCKTKNSVWFDDIEKCNKMVKTVFFRPPYGRISRRQTKLLAKTYQIVLWSMITEDYNPNLSKERCLKNAIRRTQDGDIILFHDSEKAAKNVLYVLPKYIEYFKNQGFRFEKL